MFKDVAWRAMTAFDLPEVARIAARVHPDFPESEAVLAERQQLYHHGCYLLEIGHRPVGYVLSHPWRQDILPALDSLLGALPSAPSTYYLHDLALLPVARRIGAASRIVAALTRHAEARGFPQMSLVAVNGSAGFWERHGFVAEARPGLDEALRSYAPAARLMVRPLAAAPVPALQLP